jgi:hypothetical protein
MKTRPSADPEPRPIRERFPPPSSCRSHVARAPPARWRRWPIAWTRGRGPDRRAHGERSAARTNPPQWHRARSWETRVGAVPLAIPKLRKGSYFPAFLEPRQREGADRRPLLIVVSASRSVTRREGPRRRSCTPNVSAARRQPHTTAPSYGRTSPQTYEARLTRQPITWISPRMLRSTITLPTRIIRGRSGIVLAA